MFSFNLFSIVVIALDFLGKSKSLLKEAHNCILKLFIEW